jgi:predicted RNA-binding protein
LVFADGVIVVVVGVVLETIVVEALEIVAADVVVIVVVVDGVAAVTVFDSFLHGTGIHGLKGLTDLVSSSPSTVVIVVSSEIGSNLLFFNGAAITTGS